MILKSFIIGIAFAALLGFVFQALENGGIVAYWKERFMNRRDGVSGGQ